MKAKKQILSRKESEQKENFMPRGVFMTERVDMWGAGYKRLNKLARKREEAPGWKGGWEIREVLLCREEEGSWEFWDTSELLRTSFVFTLNV